MQPTSPDPFLGLGRSSDAKEMNGGWGVGAESRARPRVSGKTASKRRWPRSAIWHSIFYLVIMVICRKEAVQWLTQSLVLLQAKAAMAVVYCAPSIK